jgi:hypothetical protein
MAAFHDDFKVKNGLVVSTTATFLSTVTSTSTNTGALQISGGVGIAKDVYIGGTLNVATTVTNFGYALTTSTAIQYQGVPIGNATTFNFGTGTTATVVGNVVNIQESVTISDSPPQNAYTGNLWWDSTYGSLRIFFQDANGSQWVDVFSSSIGQTGLQGARGTQGSQGVQGLQGHLGAQGLQGPGIQGLQGLQGSGAQGTQGVQGLQGPQGVQGLQGSGAQGPQGVQGLQGVQGHLGVQGLQGLQGNQGVQGLQGLQGLQGNQGVQGVSIQGTQGLQGLQGVQGLQGQTGIFSGTTTATVNINNNTQSTNTASGALTVTGGVGVGGNLYVGGTTNVSGTVNLNTSILTSPKLQSYKETVNTIGSVVSNTNLDISTANIFDVTLGGSPITFTFTNPPSSGTAQPVTVILRQDATGSRLATFTNAKYTDGSVPVLSTGANQIDVLTFFTVNGGAFWFGTFAMANVS